MALSDNVIAYHSLNGPPPTHWPIWLMLALLILIFLGLIWLIYEGYMYHRKARK